MRFLKEVRTAKSNDIGTLRRALRTTPTEDGTDLFEVEFRGILITVQRQDIERVR